MRLFIAPPLRECVRRYAALPLRADGAGACLRYE